MADAITKKPAAAGGAMDVSTALELFSIAGSLNSTLDLDFLLQKIGAAAEKLLDSEASAIMLVSDDGKHLFFKVASGDKAKALKTMTLPIGKGIGGWVAQNRRPEVVVDTRSDPRFAGQFDKASGFVTRSLMCVPMLFRGDIVGVVEVLNKRAGTYTQEHVGVLSSLANLAAVAITNAKIVAEQKNFFSHTLELLSGVIETSRPGMDGHPARSAKLACAIGRMLGVDEYDYRMLYYAGLLHDVGYVAYKNRRFLAEMGISNPAEEMHPTFSVQMLEGVKMLEGAIPMIQHHHERYDGTGFPGKLKGDAIPLGARILGLVESMEEIRMMGVKGDELYKRATQEAKTGAGGRFDPKVAQAFAELLATQEGILVSSARPLRVLIAKPGLDGHDRGAKVIVRALRDAGFEVIYTGIRQSPEMIANSALQEDVDAVGLSLLSGAHMTLFPQITALLKEKGLKGVLVFGGGIIPDEDVPVLKKKGVDRVFGPGTPLSAIVSYLKEKLTGAKTR